MDFGKKLFEQACETLRRAGFEISPSEIAGLTWVNGKELTMFQVIDLAEKHA